MNLSFVRKHRFPVVVGAAAIAMVLGTVVGELAVASNMGFKMNKQLVVGKNLVAFPFRTPITTSSQICTTFSSALAQFAITQFNGTPTPDNWTCNQGGAGFNVLAKGTGLLVTLSSPQGATTGIVVGSHIPGQSVTVFTGPAPRGRNVYGYPYHTTNTSASNVCQNGGLANTGAGAGASASLTRFGPSGGVDGSHTCAQVTAGFALRLGEGVLIESEPGLDKVFVPTHF